MHIPFDLETAIQKTVLQKYQYLQVCEIIFSHDKLLYHS